MAKHYVENVGESHHVTELPQVWKSYLYLLQQKAPIPKRILCDGDVPNKPPHYGREFHGTISREETEELLRDAEGSYLIRESARAPGQYTLSLQFDGQTKNFRLYYDGMHYVGEKRFSTLQDLVKDGLITMYLELHASDYIRKMVNDSKYENSPYMTLSHNNKRHGTRRETGASVRKHRRNDEFTLNGYHEYDQPTESELSTLKEATVESASATLNFLELEKAHSFKVHNFKGLPWCDFCGNFMWGLIAQGVRCDDCGFVAHNRCSEKVPSDCMPDAKHVKRVFGVDLTTLAKINSVAVPFVVTLCVAEIERRGLFTEGIYRVSGFTDEVDALRISFDTEGDQVSLDAESWEDIHVVSGVLKLFLRLLPIPLITFDAYTYFIKSARHNRVDDQLDGLKQAIGHLPPAHLQTLKFLMQHLQTVTDHEKKNLMSARNLSTVFAPTLMRSPDMVEGCVNNMDIWEAERITIELLITYQRIIFEH